MPPKFDPTAITIGKNGFVGKIEGLREDPMLTTRQRKCQSVKEEN